MTPPQGSYRECKHKTMYDKHQKYNDKIISENLRRNGAEYCTDINCCAFKRTTCHTFKHNGVEMPLQLQVMCIDTEGYTKRDTSKQRCSRIYNRHFFNP